MTIGVPLPDNGPPPEPLPQGMDKEWLKDLHGMIWELQSWMKINYTAEDNPPTEQDFDKISEYIERTVNRLKKQNGN